MVEHVETVIVGGGQAGLSASYCLGERGREHVVLEQATQPGSVWRRDRWDSFRLVTPNWSMRLPGAEYQGDDPNGFMPRDQVVTALAEYADRYRMPLQYGTRVLAVEPRDGGAGFRVKTGGMDFGAENVIMATGHFQKPNIPPAAAGLPDDVAQMSSGQYRNPQALPPGAVLVVGSAQSGSQIAEELYQAGRRVYLSVSSAGRAPRRYRGRDIFYWLVVTGFMERPVDRLPSPEARIAGSPHVSGKDGGHTLNLHQFARDGVVLLGRIEGAREGKIWLTDDLPANLAKADQFEAEILKLIDKAIEAKGLDAPEDSVPRLSDGYAAAIVRQLDLRAEGIGSVIWATGYRSDLGMVKLPVLGGDGFPVQNHGVSPHRGLYFVGMPWMPTQKTGLFLGIGENASHIADHIAGRNGRRGR